MYRKSIQGWMKHWDFMVLDLLCLQIAFLMAYFVRHGFLNPYESYMYRNMALVLILFQNTVVVFGGTLKNVLKRKVSKELAETAKQVTWVTLLAVFYLFVIQEGQMYSRAALLMMCGIYGVLTTIVRLLWKKRLKKKGFGKGSRSLLIVTTREMAKEVVDNLCKYSYETFRLTGIAVLDCNMRGEKIEGVEVVADRENVTDYVCREWVDEILVSLPNNTTSLDALINQFIEMGVVVHVELLKAQETWDYKRFVERIGNYTVLTTSMNYATVKQIAMKRVLDIIGGLVGCGITLVLILIIGPMIYIQSPGPIFFSQIRVGKNGKKFKIYKFRSMYIDAEERKKELLSQNRVKDGRMFKLDWDPRIIGSQKLPDGRIRKGIGNYIRDRSLDEFPQFFNVLKGDMSLVGTRPPTVDEWNQYDLHHRTRLAIKPGITGMWQVSGRSNVTDFEEVVKLDKKYIAEWSFGLDIKILFKTVKTVIKKEGAM